MWCHLESVAIRHTGCLPLIVFARCIKLIGNRSKASSVVPTRIMRHRISAVQKCYMTMLGLGLLTLSLRTITAFMVLLSSMMVNSSMAQAAYSARQLRRNLCCSRAGVQARTVRFTWGALRPVSAHMACPFNIAVNRCSFILIHIRRLCNFRHHRLWCTRILASRTKA